MEIRARNVNAAISEALWKLKVYGVTEQTRNGPVIAFPEPVMTTYERPQERVLFWGERDANPIFHVMESIWMLAGRRDVAFLEQFNSKIGQYSDDGEVFNAPYGYRWRDHFGYDQLPDIIRLLKKDHTTRQAVLQIWEPDDLFKTTKDKACNTQAFFEIRQGVLNMTVLNRSNDLWYGCYGANVVHFSFLMEFIASAVGVPMGVYRQFSHNLHLYTSLYDAAKYLEYPPDSFNFDAYSHGITPYPIMNHPDPETFLRDCEYFCKNPFEGGRFYYNSFFHDVAHPMAMVSKVRKDKTGDGMYWADRIHAQDWRIAVTDWIERRESAKLNKAAPEAAKRK